MEWIPFNDQQAPKEEQDILIVLDSPERYKKNKEYIVHSIHYFPGITTCWGFNLLWWMPFPAPPTRKSMSGT